MKKQFLVFVIFLAFCARAMAFFCSLTDSASNSVIFCDAPPPSNFRIVERGPNYLTVAWTPVDSYATCSIVLSSCNALSEPNNWVAVDTFWNIKDSIYTVYNAPYGIYHKLNISTDCDFNDTGTNTDSLLDKSTLDLLIPGRVPLNPVVVDCHNIEFENPDNEWVGFRVTYNDGENIISNLFEFEYEYSLTLKTLNAKAKIKRVSIENPIVASNLVFEFPEVPGSSISSPNPFNIIKLDGYFEPEIAGRIGVTKNFTGIPKVDICVNETLIEWDYLKFSFEALVAQDVLLTELGMQKPEKQSLASQLAEIKIKSISKGAINFDIERINELDDVVYLYFSDMLGKNVFSTQIESNRNRESLSLNNLTTGVYVIQLKSVKGSKNVKLFIP